MSYDPEKHFRRSIRLKGYDYSRPGMYFVTLCTQNRECLFGEIVNSEMQLNEFGKIVDEEWRRSPEIRNEIELDEYSVMPNHVHGIITIIGSTNVGAFGERPLNVDPNPPRLKPKSLGSLITGFESSVTRRINQIRKTPGAKVWQRNYHDHIIRNEKELNIIRAYIRNNPKNWHKDAENRMGVRNIRV